MSPLLLRRYRADRLLREEFEQQRGRVIEGVAARLRRAGVALDRDDLEAAYAQAWQGLYAAVLEGQQIINPVGWLAVVTHRRAIDEHRARGPADPDALVAECARDECDFATKLDDRAKLHCLLEAMRVSLNDRERQAAALCYLQGLSRAEAAAQMGVSESRMRKLMEGTGRGLQGVAAKVGALVQTIAAGEWCEQQGSLMRGFAFGVLDPGGERYRIAVRHSEGCPACRAYVRSLRGLAVVLPPAPMLLHWALAAGSGAGVGAAAGASAVAGSGSSLGGTSACAGTPAASGIGSGALSASGAAGAGAAGGGWWLAGGLGAKLAVGCLLALGVSAGCVALDGQLGRSTVPLRHAAHSRPLPSAYAARGVKTERVPTTAAQSTAGTAAQALGSGHDRPLAQVARAVREFGPERSAATAAGGVSKPGAQLTARAASVATSLNAARRAASPGAAVAPARAYSAHSGSSAGSSVAAATREFAPG
ncbi:MAG TPA: sigma-70 family RNA polymerase sigma factor [Solirubrobacteraceae bacterium]